MSVLSSLETSSSPASPSSCRKKHIVCKPQSLVTIYVNILSMYKQWQSPVCKPNMSFGLFHCCELTSCGFSASLSFLFLLTWSYVLFSLSNFSLLSNLIFFAVCSTPVMCHHISWILDYVVKNARWVTRIIE